MRYTRYSPIGIREITPDILHMGSFCKPPQRRRCEKAKECLQDLCHYDRNKIGKVSPFKLWKYGDKTSDKIERAVKKYRKEQFKACRAIEYVIRRQKC